MSQSDSKLTTINECLDVFADLNNSYYLVASIKIILENRYYYDDTEWMDHVESLLYRYIDETESLMPKMNQTLQKLLTKKPVTKLKQN